MKTLLRILSLLTLFFTSHSIAYSQIGEGNESFSFTAFMQKQYYPGENISLKIWLNEGRFYKGEERSHNFEVKVFRIIELDSFYLAQNYRNSIDALGKDSINLLKYCTEIKSLGHIIGSKGRHRFCWFPSG